MVVGRGWMVLSGGLLGLVLALAAAAYVWLNTPLALSRPVLDLSIEPGSSAREVAQAVADAGVQVRPDGLFLWFRLSGRSRELKAGSYELRPGLTPRDLLALLVRGLEAVRSVTLVEGQTFSQFRKKLSREEHLVHDAQGLEPDVIMEKLARPGLPAEGRFYPDTYTYAKGSSELALLRRALHAMDRHLDAAWQARASDSPLNSPQDLLILASIIEKETGLAADRPMIASVFVNRLRTGMMLQTDPTVIYGLGERFDGNLRRSDLRADTPWNTYTRAGLPPTPIAMPGRAALWAAAQPARSRALYFVARGDGSSQFSETLADHNQAVARYQLGR